MSPIQQMLLGVGAVATKTYVDDVFSTYVYEGDGNSSRNITNNIDLLTEGGLVWYKSRSAGKGHRLVDTERGVTKVIESNDSNAEAVEATGLKAFLTNGFTVGSDDTINESGGDQASWSFRKAPGFFTCLTYVGNGSNRTISHDLGCVPGMIILKNLDASDHWVVYHRGNADSNNAAHYSLRLNTTAAKADWFNYFQDTLPTATEFTLGTDSDSNGNGENFIAYLFAGGESTAATARSVKFDGSDDYIRTPDHSDLDLDTNQFTIEMWVKSSTDPSSGNMNLVGQWGGNDRGYAVRYSLADQSFNGWGFQYCTNEQGSDVNTINGSTGIDDGQWHHLAVVRESSTIKLYTDGNLSSSTSISGSLHITNSERDFYVGSDDSDNRYTGNVSNVRVVVGTALYTSSFKPPTEPLTNVTNTKLLCCNNSSVTGSTVSPGTFYSGGGPTASSNSPFDDPAGFSFGDAGDQNVIKCGSYVGTGSAGLEVNLGFEPQWLMVKRTNGTSDWHIVDSMRGIVSGGNDPFLEANTSNLEGTGSQLFDLTARGFTVEATGTSFNHSGSDYIFLAIRRPDGYVGKPPELGTGVFAMDTGNAAGTITPAFDSGFPVDFGFYKTVASSVDWISGSRLTGTKYMKPNGTDAETTSSDMIWDVNTGWQSWSGGTGVQAWMWKRHAGFDVVTITNYDSTAGPTYTWHPHSLGKKPEMIWVKRRDSSQEWWVYHHGANGGTNPWNNYLQLHSDAAEGTLTGFFGESGPTATTFSLKRGAMTDGDFIFMLFASVDGISKVGSYTGNGQNWHGIEVGFAPRFYMIKKVSGTGDWFIVDNTRGLDENLLINETDAQAGPQHIGTPSSTTWYIGASGSTSILNTNNEKYIYYVHA